MKRFLTVSLLIFQTGGAVQAQDDLKLNDAKRYIKLNSTRTAGSDPEIIADLENTTWETTIISTAQASVDSNADAHLATARFVNGVLSGKSGCNQFSATYLRKDSQLSIGPIRTMRKACVNPEIMKQEARYLNALTYVSQYRVNAGQLKLFDNNGLVIVSFNRQKE